MALSTDQLLRKAKSHASKGEFGPAAQIYQSVLERFPKNKRAVEGLRAIQMQAPAASVAPNMPPQNQINTLVALFNQGRFDEVIQFATTLTSTYPNHIAAYDLLGAVYAQRGDFDKSVSNYKMAIRVNPGFAEAYNNLAFGLTKQGQLDEAIACCQKALQIKPNYAEAHNTLGNAFKEQGNLGLALSSYENVLKFNPNHAEALLNIGNVQQIQGQLDDAIENFEKGLQINPGIAEGYLNLGNALQETGRLDEAISIYEQALQINPDFGDVHIGLGSAYEKKGNPDAVIQHFEKALQINPDNAELHRNLGVCQMAHGKLDMAIASYKRAIDLKPNYANAYKNYTTAMKFETEDDYTRKIDDLLQSSDLTQRERADLCFAMSKVKMDIGESEEGFKLLEAGNTLRKNELNYDVSNDEILSKNIQRVFSDDSDEGYNILFDDEPDFTPIFVLGMPRSGTTLVEQIISSHSQVFGAGELNFLDHALHHIDWANYTLSHDDIVNIRSEYFDRASGLNTDRRFIVDKMPANFRWIGFIEQAFPEAKIIHLNRSPEAVCWSIYKLGFSESGMGFCFDMEDVARYHRMYQDIMKFWHDLLPDRIYDLDYEKLTENQLEETQSLFRHIGLDWEDTALDFHKNERNVATASNVQIRSEMYRGSSNKWKEYEPFLGPMLKILNGAG